jgi:hypothetical protein
VESFVEEKMKVIEEVIERDKKDMRVKISSLEERVKIEAERTDIFNNKVADIYEKRVLDLERLVKTN